jgi:hypothetical protein
MALVSGAANVNGEVCLPETWIATAEKLREYLKLDEETALPFSGEWLPEKLPERCSVWDLGIGYARAADAATDGEWLKRAKQCDKVHVCFGVNDTLRNYRAEEILQNLQRIIQSFPMSPAAGTSSFLRKN